VTLPGSFWIIPRFAENSMADAAVTIIGGGVVGLAIAAEVGQRFSPVFLLERNPHCGMETSSRNSEVIHAGIYYPHDSLKARLCVEGNDRLYVLCQQHGIPHRKITKIITAASEDQIPALETLYRHGRSNGVELEYLDARAVHQLEPAILSAGGILSRSTGIISAHGLMDFFQHTALAAGVTIQTHCEVVDVEKRADDFRISIAEAGVVTEITTEMLINASGLEADTIASMTGIDVDAAGYRLHWAKGSYFSLQGEKRKLVSRLVYPIPPRESLGVHVVIDLGGSVRFGPDVEYLEHRTPDYTVDRTKRHEFGNAVRQIIPAIMDEDLTPAMSGIRPKLQAKGEPPKDFIIREESDKGCRGLINLIGIDSPGLTSSPAIARYVMGLVG
jgi:L-2-hydroxyglutarate oxidase LhgO